MCQGLWHFLPTLPSNVKVSIHTTWHTTATQVFKSQLHFLWEVCVYHSHMVTTHGHLMIQGMREWRPSPKLTSVRPAFSCWGVSLDYRKALWKVCRHRLICENNASALRLLCGFLPDTTAFPLPSSESSFSSWIQERNAPHPLRFCLRNLPLALVHKDHSASEKIHSKSVKVRRTSFHKQPSRVISKFSPPQTHELVFSHLSVQDWEAWKIPVSFN